MTLSDNATAEPFPELFRDDVFRLETRRLWLRWPVTTDADDLHEIASLEVVARQTATWPHPIPAGEALRRIEQARSGNTAGTTLQLALTEKSAPGKLIGLLGLHAEKKPGTLGLGYMLDVKHQGFGIMTEAVRTLVACAFRFTDTQTLRGASRTANVASRRVMEKAGFRCVGEIDHTAPARGAPERCNALELTRAEWRTAPSLSLIVPSRSAPSQEMPCGCAA